MRKHLWWGGLERPEPVRDSGRPLRRPRGARARRPVPRASSSFQSRQHTGNANAHAQATGGFLAVALASIPEIPLLAVTDLTGVTASFWMCHSFPDPQRRRDRYPILWRDIGLRIAFPDSARPERSRRSLRQYRFA